MGSQEFLVAAFVATVVLVLGFVASVAVALFAARGRTQGRAIIAAAVCFVLGMAGVAALIVSLTLNLARGGR